jgi:hypothetical protein
LLPHTARKITVYNFGIEGATLEAELLTLKRFREIYALDEVLFYSGSNDVLKVYWEATTGRRDFDNFVASGFEERSDEAIQGNAHGPGLLRPCRASQ